VKPVKREFGLDGQVFDDEETAFEHDMFPVKPYPPIVHIDRPPFGSEGSLELEEKVYKRVTYFKGVFAGT
jgi:hypothetical protein